MPAAPAKNLTIFLRDMKEDRQYVAAWAGGELQGVAALEAKGRVPLESGKKLFAICDAVTFIRDENKIIAATFGGEISVDAQGQATGVRLAPLEYDVEHAMNGDRCDIHYILTGASAEALSELGMDVAGLWEKKFSRPAKDPDPANPEKAFALPPRHTAPLYSLETTAPVAVGAPLKFRRPVASR